jgi:hypothetical protein
MCNHRVAKLMPQIHGKTGDELLKKLCAERGALLYKDPG